MIDIDEEAKKEAEQASEIIEHFQASINQLKALEEENPSSPMTPEIKNVRERLEALFETVDQSPDEVLEENLSPPSRQGGRIARLNKGPEIIRLAEQQRWNAADIGRKVGEPAESVRRFLSKYNNAKATERSQLRHSSVFNTYQGYEDINALVRRKLHEVDTTDPEVFMRGISELRQLYAQADKWMKEQKQVEANNERYERILQAVSRILQGELPEKKDTIIREIGKLRIHSDLDDPEATEQSLPPSE